MKILILDCETAPNKTFTWGLWQQNISIHHMIESSGILCWSAKWLGEKKVHFDSVYNTSKKKMLRGVHSLLSQADVIVTYNGKSFDIPVLNREFLIAGFPPPAPYKHIDMLKVARNVFRFQSNKLEFVSRETGLGGKVKHEGFQLWVKCMDKDPAAWGRMEKYNKGDVRLLEKNYLNQRAWIPNHPNVLVYTGEGKCPKCGSKHVQSRGIYVGRVVKHKRYVCTTCHSWLRGEKISLSPKYQLI